MTVSPIAPTGQRRRRERAVAVAVLLLIAAAWLVGAARQEADLMPAVQQAIPEAGHIVKTDNGLYRAWTDDGESELLGYVAIGTANGYGGPLRVAVAVAPSGEIIGTAIASHKETATWMRRVDDSGLLESLAGKSYSEPFQVGNDIDGVTGATYTSKALAEAVLAGSRGAARHLGLPVQPTPPPRIVFGTPEIVLLALFIVGYFAHQKRFRYTRQARWTTLLVGMVVLGFIYNSPVTLAYIVKLILGYWPQWQTNLYWYFLIGGILLVFTIDNKNPYCYWFCPFGAAQDCMGVIGRARPRPLSRLSTGLLRWLQRGLALAAVMLGVLFRSPGLASYELFGALFALVGTTLQLLALGLVLIASLFITRPWCSYLCPLRPVVDLIRVLRDWIKEPWKKRKPKEEAVA
jgi:hypothetical protein